MAKTWSRKLPLRREILHLFGTMRNTIDRRYSSFRVAIHEVVAVEGPYRTRVERKDPSALNQ